MENRQANKLDNKTDAKFGQSQDLRVDNVNYADYANLSASDLAKLREQRKNRRSSLSGAILQTHVPAEFLNENLHYEWVIDDPIVIKNKTADGWVVVCDEKLAALKGCSTTTSVKIPSGISDKNGNPEYLILMAIRKEFYEDDILAKKRAIKTLSDRIDQGQGIVSSAEDGADRDIGGLQVKEVKVE